MNNHRWKPFIIGIALFTLSVTTAMSAEPEKAHKNVLYGIGEPLVHTGINSDKSSKSFRDIEYILEAMNFGAIREWMHIPYVLDNPTQVNPLRKKSYDDALELYKRLGIEITGMSHQWYIVDQSGNVIPSDGKMYRRNTAEGSPYLQSLAMIEQAWKTMAKNFPQVTQWEVGNEWNTSDFLNVYPETDKPLTDGERIEIATDMMYYAYKGIKAGNPAAQVVSFSPTISIPKFLQKNGSEKMVPFTNPGYSIALALSRVYDNIASGDFPAGMPADTNPDHYFDIVAWHPYMYTGMNPSIASETFPGQGRFYREEHIDALWQNINDNAYNVMVMNGDADKKVILTEMGFCDMQDPQKEETHLQEYERMFKMISESMPYIKTVHVFRLLTADAFNSNLEAAFGLFWEEIDSEGDGKMLLFQPRKKAYTLQKIMGGTLPLKR